MLFIRTISAITLMQRVRGFKGSSERIRGQGPKANAKETQSPKQLSPKSFNLRYSRWDLSRTWCGTAITLGTNLDYSRVEIGADARHCGWSCGYPPQTRHNAADAPRFGPPEREKMSIIKLRSYRDVTKQSYGRNCSEKKPNWMIYKKLC